MATNWDSEMQDKFDKLQAALTDEFRTQFKTMGAELEELLAERLEERLTERLDARLGHRLNVQAEQLREIVQTAADRSSPTTVAESTPSRRRYQAAETRLTSWSTV